LVAKTTESRTTTARATLFFFAVVTFGAAMGGYVLAERALERSIALERRVAENVGRILLLDETLTMSARMAASARDPRYEARYLANVDGLDALIKGTIALLPDPEVARAVSDTDVANARLVDMELRSFELDRAGRHDEALRLLEGADYRDAKAIYSAGMARAFAQLESGTARSRMVCERRVVLLQLVGAVALLALLGAWLLDERARRHRATDLAAVLERTVGERTRQLEERTTAMRKVLDTVQEGLLTMDARGVIGAERSAVVTRWFGETSGRITLADYLRAHDPVYARSLELGLEQLQADFLPLEACLDQFPRTLRSNGRTLSVAYECVCANGVVETILVVMNDVTSKLERERLEEERRDLVSAFEIASRDRAGFIRFADEVTTILAELAGPRPVSLERVRILLHTLKGNAAQLRLHALARTCHEVEDHLAEEPALRPSDLEQIEGVWRRTMQQIRALVVEPKSHAFDVAKEDYEGLIALLRAGSREGEVLERLSSWTLDRVHARLERLADYARALGERLQKPLDVVVDANGVRVDGAYWSSLFAVSVHLVRNAVDHGLETPRQRAASNKPARSVLRLESDLEGDTLVLRVADDGRGIDWGVLEAKARDRGVRWTHPSELLFAGVSSRDEAGELSGRGVGMKAVKAEIERRGGTIRVDAAPGRGTTIEVRLPVRAAGSVWKPGSADVQGIAA